MSGVWGHNLKVSLFGESHGKCVGVVINGLPPGIKLDLALIRRELSRRAPGKSKLSSPRQEDDEFDIVSGLFEDRTTGSPLTCMIWNQDQRSRDYEETKNIIRPGHADFTARLKYEGYNDYRGGGHFSGRLTAPLVIAGAIARQILGDLKISIGSHILRIGEIREENFDPVDINSEQLLELREKEFPVLDEEFGEEMKKLILRTKADHDSVGGIVETAVVGLSAGLGSPFFDSVESKIAYLLFSIPAVKGVEFGAGFDLAQMTGSEANDAFILKDKSIQTKTNHCGGIQGGITNGMPVIFRTAFKPTPSISKPQKTVDMAEMEEIEISIQGRHDPCIVPRAVPVVEAVSALALLDLLIDKDGWHVTDKPE